MGEPQRPQTIGSTSYTLAIRRAHAALRSAEQTESSGSWFSCLWWESGESRCLCFQPSGASAATYGLSVRLPRLREEYSP